MQIKKFFSIIAVLTVTISTQAAKVSDYFVHQRIKGSSETQGEWDFDYVQLIPREGRPLSAGDLRINAELRSTPLEEVCFPVDDKQEAQFSSSYQTTDVTFVSDRLLAVSINYEVSCAGTAHPSFGVSSAIYDRKIGRAIDISTGLPVSERENSAADQAFDILVLNEMGKQAARQKALRADRGCDDYYDPSNLNYTLSGLALSPKAISVDLVTPHAAMACGFTTVIPLEKFLPVARKGSLLEELAKAAAKSAVSKGK